MMVVAFGAFPEVSQVRLPRRAPCCWSPVPGRWWHLRRRRVCMPCWAIV